MKKCLKHRQNRTKGQNMYIYKLITFRNFFAVHFYEMRHTEISLQIY